MTKQSEIKEKVVEISDSESLLRETAGKLRTVLRSLGTAGAGEHDATVRGISRVSTAIAAVCGEIRQHAKGRLRALGEFPIGDVVAYLRSLPKAQRDKVFTSVFDAEESEPLL